jgi:hypothetical protein
MGKVIVNVNDLEKIQKAIEKMKRNIPDQITLKNDKVTYEEYRFTERQRSVFEYIKNNPGGTKQCLVNKFSGVYARNTTLKIIAQLENAKVIIVRQDKNNSQNHLLFVNNENILVSLIAELDAIKKSFILLIDKIKTLGYGKEYNVINALLFAYKCFFVKYTISDLFLSPQLQLDQETMHKKFTLVFDVIREIHAKLSECMGTKTWNVEELRGQVLYSMIFGGLDTEWVDNVLKTFEEYGLTELAGPVLKRSVDLFPKAKVPRSNTEH